MPDDLPWPFLLLWGVTAVGLGGFFALRPDIPADIYIAQMARFGTTNRLRHRLAPRGLILIVYRIAGTLFVVVGVTVPTLLLLGILGPRA